MKRVVLVLAALAVTFSAAAQDNPVAKGNVVVTVPLVQYGTGDGDLYKTTDIGIQDEFLVGLGGLGFRYGSASISANNFNPSVQYFVLDGLAVGVSLGFSSVSGDGLDASIFSAGPQLAYYYRIGSFIPFAGVDYLWKRIDEGSSGDVMYGQWICPNIGALYQFSPHFSVFAGVSYSIDSLSVESKSADGTWLSATAGIKAFF